MPGRRIYTVKLNAGPMRDPVKRLPAFAPRTGPTSAQGTPGVTFTRPAHRNRPTAAPWPVLAGSGPNTRPAGRGATAVTRTVYVREVTAAAAVTHPPLDALTPEERRHLGLDTPTVEEPTP